MNLQIISFCLFRFALGGAASRVFKNELNTAHINNIIGHIFESLRSLDWIEVTIFMAFLVVILNKNILMQDVAATENRKLEWVDEEEIDSASNGINDVQDAAGEEENDGDDSDNDELADEQ